MAFWRFLTEYVTGLVRSSEMRTEILIGRCIEHRKARRCSMKHPHRNTLFVNNLAITEPSLELGRVDLPSYCLFKPKELERGLVPMESSIAVTASVPPWRPVGSAGPRFVGRRQQVKRLERNDRVSSMIRCTTFIGSASYGWSPVNGTYCRPVFQCFVTIVEWSWISLGC